MNERIFASAQLMGEALADELCALALSKPRALICLAAGHSSLPVFEQLAARKQRGFDFASLRFVAMDEWAGMNDRDAESCGGFLQRYFLRPLGLPSHQIRLFDGRVADPARECAAVEAFIAEHGGIDFMLLGVGMNGHLALNEPGCAINSGAHVVQLSDSTKAVGQKYFNSPVVLSGGLSLGLANIMAARTIVVNVTGSHKAPVVKRLREAAAGDMDFPASALKDLCQARFYFDAEAAGA
jgi:galactosamine-6-phosphate isomerase